MVQTTFCSIQPPAGSGKTMGTQEQMIRTTATHTNNAVAVQAEVVMNAYYNSLFNKNVDGVLLKGTPAQQPALWSLLPNPTKQQQVTLSIKQGLLAGQNRADVSIYNFNGTLLRQVKGLKNNETISVADLPTGIYICVLHIGSRYIGSQKLVVLP
ncbi:MAG TPA: T9SS type A sorting domain-containing protein [Chitinophagales bacterium]|nr:T9SS type A sorting domain-containing protein [Chitinophagales bacterium]